MPTVLAPVRAVVARGPRTLVLVGFALAGAVLMAWALRDRAQFPPSSGPVALPPGAHGHSGGGTGPPPSVTGEVLANVAGLVFLGLHILLPVAFLVALVVTRLFRGKEPENGGVAARLVFAAGFAVAAALMTPLLASFSLGTAITFANSLAAAVIVAQYTFALSVVGVTVLGVP